jgi:hypothetical protein
MMDTIENPAMSETASQIVVANYLKGGIGNQLFQYVFAKSLAKKLGAGLLSDVSFFSADPYNNQSVLKNFDPGAKLTVVSELIGPGAYMLRDGVMSSLQDQLNLPPDAKVLALDGYWQNERLLDREVVSDTYAAIAQHLRAVGESTVAQDILNEDDAVAIHIRRRDYGHMGVCESSYYVGAIDFIRKRYPDSRLYVFSDEPNYAQQFLGSRYQGVTLVSSGGDLSDLYLMSLCKHFVIANSTYSWWAAYFAEGKGGVIVCPKEWVTIAGVPSPCPDRWIQVKGAVRPMHTDAWAAAAVEQDIHVQLHAAALRRWQIDGGEQLLANSPDHGNSAEVVVYMASGGLPNWVSALVQAVLRCDSVDGLVAEAQRLQVNEFDLLRVDLGGREFTVLNELIDRGLIARCKTIQIRFNGQVGNAVSWREALGKRLSLTHQRRWDYYFVWEEWVRQKGVQRES